MLTFSKLASLCVLTLLFCVSDSYADRQPNLLFLLADDLRYDAIGAHGNPIVQTPHLDRLATNATSFDRAFVTTSICMISRASIMTGQYACRHGIYSFGPQLSPQQLQSSYFGQLMQAGYRVGFVGKWGVGSPPRDFFDFNAGYDGQGKYYGPPTDDGQHLTQYLRSRATEFIDDQQQNEQPFCLSISFKAPHVDDGNAAKPFNHDRRLKDLYSDVTIPPAPLSSSEFFESMPSFLRESENRIRWQHRFGTEALYQSSVKDYYRLVTGMDTAIGEIIAQLEDRDLLENTVIVFASDHGFYLGERGFAGKWYPHDISLQIPILIRDYRTSVPGAPTRCQAVALNIDLAPTLLDYAGLKAPEAMQGRSLRPLVEGENPSEWRDDFYYSHPFEYESIPRSEGLRTSAWKYIIYRDSGDGYEELYSLLDDPDEEKNLATNPAYRDELERLRKRMAIKRQQACEERVARNP